MLLPRIIPCLLLSEESFINTVKFEFDQYLGDPFNIISQFNKFSADEIVILDIHASKKQKGPNFKLIKNLSSEAFLPLAYGGGISSLTDAEKLIDIGIEKLVIGSHLEPNLLQDIAKKFGQQCIIASVDCRKNFFGKYKVYKKSGQCLVSKNIVEHIKFLENIGVGEFLLQSINNDGIMKGYDLELIKLVSKSATVPVIACSGASKRDDLLTAVYSGASAAGASSIFVYSSTLKSVLINYPSINEREKLFKSSTQKGTLI